MSLPSQELLHTLFEYRAEDGALIRKIAVKRFKIGERAGTHHRSGYRRVRVEGKLYSEHRVIWLYHYGELPNLEIDHINRVRHDNRIENLRLVPRGVLDNAQNQKLSKNNTSGCTGVHWDKRHKLWVAFIKVNWKHTYLGGSKDKDEAIALRKAAERKYFPFKTQEAA